MSSEKSADNPAEAGGASASGSDQPEVLAVLFADLCDSARLYSDLGDAAAHALAAQCLTLIADVTVRYGGKVIKTISEGSMTTFPHAELAYQAAVEMQDRLHDGPVSIKIGFHVGPVIFADGDVFGDTVNLAARVLARAGAGEILLTGPSVEAIRAEHKANLSLLDTTVVKGRPEPVEIYRVISDEKNVTIIVPSARVIERRKAVIFSYQGNDLRHDTRASPLLIGRDAGCRIVVESEWASRRHCTIDVQRDRFMLTDHSSNGTFIVEEGAAPQIVKREAANLAGSGVISLGITPDEKPDCVIRYRYVPGVAPT